jgi:hypothetical protein
MIRSLSKIIMILALGVMLSMFGIVACKNPKSRGGHSNQIYSGYSGYSSQSAPAGHAPLPSTVILLGSGLVGLGLLGWKKRKKP